MLVSKVLPVARCAPHDLPEAGNIFRVNSLLNEFLSGRDRPLVLEDPKALVRPVDSSAGRSPSKAACLTQPLGLGQIGLAPPQIFFGLPAYSIFDGQFAVEVSVLERDRCL